MAKVELKFGKYMRQCPYDGIDVYRVLTVFEVTDPALQHAVKKLLCAGKRGAKDMATDIRETIIALERWEEMRREEEYLAEAEYNKLPKSLRKKV